MSRWGGTLLVLQSTLILGAGAAVRADEAQEIPPLAAAQGAGNKARPASARAVFEQARQDFDDAVELGDDTAPQARDLYQSALHGFQSLLDEGTSNGRLEFNVANTHMRLGDVGRAIVYYRRAKQLMPRDADIDWNLEAARRRCPMRIDPPATRAVARAFFFWHFGLSTSSRTRAALIGYIAFWMILAIGLAIRRRPPALRWSAVVVAVVTVALWSSVGWDRVVEGRRPAAVVIADQAVVRKGYGVHYDPQFKQPLTAGVELRILSTQSDRSGKSWHRIELPDGRNGWLPAETVDVI